MSYPIQYSPANSSVFFPFATYGKTNGQSITLSGLLASDIEVYKLPSMTQRASDAGYTLLDTDGIDLDGITGIHGFSIDLSNDSDAGFYAVGFWYLVVVSSVTVDTETVSFIAGMFRIMEAENQTGVPDVNVTHWHGSPVPLPNVAGVPIVDVGYSGGDEITIVLPTNFSLMVIDSAGNVAANIRKVKDKGFITSVKPFDVEP